jgi:ankyrin repeat protein
MQTTFKIFVSCLFCLTLTLLSGCGKRDFQTESTPSFTPVEQAEVDKLIAEQGRSAIAYYVDHLNEKSDEQLVLKYVKYLVSQGADVNAERKERILGGSSPLLSECARNNGGANNMEVIKFLVSKGANVNAKNSDGETPLDWVISGGELHKYLESVGAKSGKSK